MKRLLLAFAITLCVVAVGLGQHHQIDTCFKDPSGFTPPTAPDCPDGQIDLLMAELCKLEYQLRMSQIETKRCNDLEAAAKQNEQDLNQCLENFDACLTGGQYTPEQCQFLADNCVSDANFVWNAAVNDANSFADARAASAADAYLECMENACVQP